MFLLTGAALGDRFGRKRMFVIGLGIFTLASAASALAPSIEALIAARAVQGFGAAIVTPLTLTLLSEAVPAQKRGLALGIWAGVTGLGVAIGPLVGGAVVQGISWHWIFWLNVPIGLALLPLAFRMLTESRGPNERLDLAGLALAGTGLLGLTFGIVRANALGWTSATVVASLTAGVVLLGAFLAWERRTPQPMLPPRFFRSRGFSATNAASFAMFFGTFGSDLPAQPVLPDRTGPRPAGGRSADAAVDGDADARRAARRHPERPDRLAPAHGRRPGAAVRRDRLARP